MIDDKKCELVINANYFKCEICSKWYKIFHYASHMNECAKGIKND